MSRGVDARTTFHLAYVIRGCRFFHHAPKALFNGLNTNPSSFRFFAKECLIEFYARIVKLPERILVPFIRAQPPHLVLDVFALLTKPLPARHRRHLRRQAVHV